MLKRRMPEVREANVNVTPLIDIVMCLIIFFMLVAKIGVASGVDPKIELPFSELGTELKDQGNALILNVSAPGGATFVTALTSKTESQPQEVKLADPITKTSPLETLLKMGKKINPDLKVIIRGQKDMAYQYLQPVLIACANAKVGSVNFSTREKTSGDTQAGD